MGKKLVAEYKKICLASVFLEIFRTKCSTFFDWKNETKILSSDYRVHRSCPKLCGPQSLGQYGHPARSHEITGQIPTLLAGASESEVAPLVERLIADKTFNLETAQRYLENLRS